MVLDGLIKNDLSKIRILVAIAETDGISWSKLQRVTTSENDDAFNRALNFLILIGAIEDKKEKRGKRDYHHYHILPIGVNILEKLPISVINPRIIKDVRKRLAEKQPMKSKELEIETPPREKTHRKGIPSYPHFTVDPILKALNDLCRGIELAIQVGVISEHSMVRIPSEGMYILTTGIDHIRKQIDIYKTTTDNSIRKHIVDSICQFIKFNHLDEKLNKIDTFRNAWNQLPQTKKPTSNKETEEKRGGVFNRREKSRESSVECDEDRGIIN